MGCTPMKLSSKSKAVKRSSSKLNPRQVSTMSRNSTINSQAVSDKALQSQPQKCIKLSLLSKSPKCARHALDLYKTQLYSQSLSHSVTYDKIRFMYSILSSDLQDFYNGCHLVCIPKGTFAQALKVFSLSIHLNPNIEYIHTKHFPYIEFSGDMTQDTTNLIRKWNSLANSIKVIIENDTPDFHNKVKELVKFQKTVQEYSEFVLKPMKLLKANKCLKSAQETINTVFKQVNELKSIISHCLCESGMKKVLKDVEGLKGIKEHTGENIVHSLF